MKIVEKRDEVTQFLLSFDEIRLCQELGRLVKEIPDEKQRFQQIDRLWEAYIPTHSKERNWAGNAKANIILMYLIWVQTLQVQGRIAEEFNTEELFAMTQNYITQTDVSPTPLLIYRKPGELFDKMQNYMELNFSLRGRIISLGNVQWIFKGYIYKVTGKYSVAQAQLLIQEAFDQERTYWEKLERKYGRGEELSRDERPSKVDPFVKTQNGASLGWNFLLSDQDRRLA